MVFLVENKKESNEYGVFPLPKTYLSTLEKRINKNYGFLPLLELEEYLK